MKRALAVLLLLGAAQARAAEPAAAPGETKVAEVTPASLRLRKRALGATERRKLARDRKAAEDNNLSRG